MSGPRDAPRLDFAVPFTEAIAWAEQRGVVPTEEFYGARLQSMRARSFAVAGLAATDQVQAVADSLVRALGDGLSFREWQREVREAEPATLGLPRGRLELIYRNAVQTAYGVGRTAQQRENAARRPYLMWDAVNDDRTRPSHAAMDGHIAPIEDDVWRVWHPPAGHNCRCSRIALTEAQARARGYPTPRPAAEPDDGWAGDPTEGNDDLLAVVRQRLTQPDAQLSPNRAAPLWAAPGDARSALLAAQAQLAPPAAPRVAVFPAPGASDVPDVSTPARAAAVAWEARSHLLDRARLAAFGLDGEVAVEAEGDFAELRRSIAELAGARGGVLALSHPTGLPFTLRSVAAARALELAELRLVTPQARHTMLPGPEGWPEEGMLAAQFVAAQPRARAETLRAVREGLPSAAAGAEFLHRVWAIVARRTGLRYERGWM